MAHVRAADDFQAIRARMEELRESGSGQTMPQRRGIGSARVPSQ
jgi:hypothetical protein